MKIYVVVIDDTHAETDVELFLSPTKAIQHAKDWAAECAIEPQDTEESQVEGYLYWCNYSPESHVCVIEKTVDDTIPQLGIPADYPDSAE